MKIKRLAYFLLQEAGIGVALLVCCIAFALTAKSFASSANLTNILTQISINTVIASGMTFVILLGGIDLSVGSVLALCSIVSGIIITREYFTPWEAILLAIIASMIVGGLCGAFNGLVSTKWKIHSFIVTLGMLNIARGTALYISNSRTFFMFPDSFINFGAINFFGVPIIFIIAIFFVVIGSIVLSKTVFGRMLYAIGNNEEAVRLSGHNTNFFKVMAFIICGGSIGIAAILYMLRLNISSPISGVGFELNAIAAVVIGGTSMSGGKGSLLGTFLGAAIIGVLNNGLLLIGLGDFARQIITGFIIVIAVILDTYRNRVLRSLESTGDEVSA